MALPKLKSNSLRHLITIKRAARVPDGKGAFTTVWSDLAMVNAEVIGLDGRESVIAQSLQGISAYRLRIRYRDDIRPADQVRYGLIDLNIRSASDPNGDREQLVIVADTASAQATT